MSAAEALKSGDLSAALEAAKGEVRAAPNDSKSRVLLFQLFCVAGDWERAMTQLNVACELDALATPMAQAYRVALNCEALRAAVHKGERAPLVLGEPAEWLGPLLESIRQFGKGEVQAADKLRAQAFDAAPTSSGKVDGEPFEWIADADPRFGPTLEAFINGKYYLVPFTNVKLIAIEPPEDLRDVVWTPAVFTWTNGGDAPGFIPTRYPGTEAAGNDDALRLSRRTEWAEAAGDLWTGLGQRLLATDQGEHPIMDIRLIELDGPEPEQEPADA